MEHTKKVLKQLQNLQMKWLDNNRVVIGIKNIMPVYANRSFELIVIVDNVRLRCAEFYVTNCTEETTLIVSKQLAYAEYIIRLALEDKNLLGRRGWYQ